MRGFDYEILLVKKIFQDAPETILYWLLKIDNKEFYFKDILKAKEYALNYKK